MTLISWQLHAIIAQDILAERRREARSARMATLARGRGRTIGRRPSSDARRRRLIAPARG